MTEPLSWPVTQVLDGLGGGGGVEAAEKVIPADHAQDLDVDDRRCRMIGVLEKASPHVVSSLRVGYDLVQAG